MPEKIDNLKIAYDRLLPLAEKFSRELNHQMSDLIYTNQITLGFPIESRVKSWDSIKVKLSRVSLNISNITDLNDFVGLRIILLFKDDVLLVQQLIRHNLAVVKEYDTQDRLKEDQFGYSSVHYIVKPPNSWLSLPTFSKMNEFKAEIQVRTLAQHIWAAASHHLQYKQEASVPPSIRRTIYRVSALLETVDLELERILSEKKLYRETVDTSIEQMSLNVDILEKMLDSLLPPLNKSNDEVFDDLLEELLFFGINTPEKLEVFVEENVAFALEQESKVAGIKKLGTTPERHLAGVYYTHVGLVRTMLGAKFSELHDNFMRRE